MLKDKPDLKHSFVYSFLVYIRGLIHKPRIYAMYIFFHFAMDFFICLFLFFLILIALKQMDGYENYSFTQNLIFSFIRSYDTLLDNINIVVLLSCMLFFIRTAKSFNFYMLEAFGLASGKILQPVILFVVLFSLLKILVLKPVYVKLENYKTQKMSNIFIQQTIKLKKGHKFTIVDEKNANEYTIISGTYNNHSNDVLKIFNAIFLTYKNDILKKVHVAQDAIFYNGRFILNNVNILSISNHEQQKSVATTTILSTKQTIDEIMRKMVNMNKIQHAIILDLYDYIDLFLKSYTSGVKSDVDIKARTYLSSEIISLFNAILCCLITFLFCVSPFRNINMVKLAFECFIIYFIILRLFHFFENVIIISNYGAVCVICLSILLCFMVQFSIVDNDWCGNFSEKIKNTICAKRKAIKDKFYQILKKKSLNGY